MPNGTVKFFNAAKGFGFITADSGGKDIFVPSASLTASGVAALKPGQRVSFEEAPDAKGPKAVNLVLLEEPPRPVAPKERPVAPKPAAEPRHRLVFYHDPASEWSCHVLSEIQAKGHEPQIVSYLEKAPGREELKTLSRLLRGGNQSLVRRYDPLFLELRLDDRFIGDNEFWDAVSENPALINGPLLASEAKACLCHTDDAVETFFTPTESEPVAAKPKGLSERALRILAGEVLPQIPDVPMPAPRRAPVMAVPPIVAPVAPAPVPVAERAPPPAVKPVEKAAAKPKAKAPAKPVAKAKPAAKAVPKAKAKPAAKPAAKKTAKKR